MLKVKQIFVNAYAMHYFLTVFLEECNININPRTHYEGCIHTYKRKSQKLPNHLQMLNVIFTELFFKLLKLRNITKCQNRAQNMKLSTTWQPRVAYTYVLKLLSLLGSTTF